MKIPIGGELVITAAKAAFKREEKDMKKSL